MRFDLLQELAFGGKYFFECGLKVWFRRGSIAAVSWNDGMTNRQRLPSISKQTIFISVALLTRNAFSADEADLAFIAILKL
jgi:hypothetical protein